MSDERVPVDTTGEQTGKQPLEDTELTGIVGGAGQDPPPPSGPPADTGWTPNDGDDLQGGGGPGSD